MSNFEVKVQKIFITPHNNADALEVGHIGSPEGWQVVTKKGLYKTGDLVAYIGENAVVPEWVLKRYGFWNNDQDKGMLGGTRGERVRAIRLRGEFSLGICIPVCEMCRWDDEEQTQLFSYTLEDEYVDEGEDVTDLLGITKYEPSLPTAMAGTVYNFGQTIGVNYDVENIKNYPNVLQEGEEVQITEKIHGTFCQVIAMPYTTEFQHDNHLKVLADEDSNTVGYIAVSSKGMGGKGLFLKHDEQNKNNVYLRATNHLFNKLIVYNDGQSTPVVMCGEVFGNNIQDLSYGFKRGEIGFRVFDVYVGLRGRGRYLEDGELDEFCEELGVERVPTLFRGPYSKDLAKELSQHTKSVFDSKQVREGIVIKSVPERTHHRGQCRVSFKVINEDYLLRKGQVTEFN